MRGRIGVALVLSMTLGLSLLAVTAHAALCVWLKPDRDIKAFFPGADRYTTEVKKHSKQQQKTVEKRLGAKLDPDENEFKFYRVKKRGKVVGTVLTHQARGKYGAVQTVIRIGTDDKIIGVYVQRDREPVNLNQKSFLKQFEGKSADDPVKLGKDIRPIRGHDRSSEAVVFSVKKMLVVYAVLNGKK